MGGIKGKEQVPSSKQEGKGRKGYSKIDGKLEGENATIPGLQVQY